MHGLETMAALNAQAVERERAAKPAPAAVPAWGRQGIIVKQFLRGLITQDEMVGKLLMLAAVDAEVDPAVLALEMIGAFPPSGTLSTGAVLARELETQASIRKLRP